MYSLRLEHECLFPSVKCLQGSAYNRPFQVVQAAREDMMGREGERDQQRPEGPITGEYMKLEKQRGFQIQAGGRCVCACVREVGRIDSVYQRVMVDRQCV